MGSKKLPSFSTPSRRTHSRIRQIVTKLSSRFVQEDDNRPGSRNARDGMSIIEKMDLWGSHCSGDHPEAENKISENFQGVEDDDDDDEEIRAPPLSAYSKAIVNSSAYKWLLTAISMQSSFHWGAGGDNVMVDEVREMILRSLPTGTISKRQRPSTFSVDFSLPWKPIQTRFDEERLRCREARHPPMLSEFIALTYSCDDEIQATTIGGTFDRLGQMVDLKLLGPLQSLLDGRSASSRSYGEVVGT